jgi:hypothetical protein
LIFCVCAALSAVPAAVPAAGPGAAGTEVAAATQADESAQPADRAKPAEPREGPLKISFTFKDEKSDCQMALTRDSVGILALDPTAGALEPDDENGFEGSVLKRALSAGERDTAGMLMGMTTTFKGRKRYACSSPDGYAFSIWSDSLTLHCENCFSCTEGISMPEAKMLARFGKLTLWLYRIKGGMQPN